MLHLPFFDDLEKPRKILLAGAGDSFDIFSELPFYFGLIRNFRGIGDLAQRCLPARRPAVPDEARQVAVEKVEAGEEITFATAREIVAEAKKKRRPKRQKAVTSCHHETFQNPVPA